MRHAADAVIAGVGTILADDPLLTDRSRLPRRRPLLRIVLDSKLRTPLDSQLVKTADQDVLIFFSQASATAQKALEARGVRLQQMRIDGPRIPLQRSTGAPGRDADHQPAARRRRRGLYHGSQPGPGGQAYAVLRAQVSRSDGDPDAGLNRRIAADCSDYSLKKFGQDFAFEAYLRDPWS